MTRDRFLFSFSGLAAASGRLEGEAFRSCSLPSMPVFLGKASLGESAAGEGLLDSSSVWEPMESTLKDALLYGVNISCCVMSMRRDGGKRESRAGGRNGFKKAGRAIRSRNRQREKT